MNLEHGTDLLSQPKPCQEHAADVQRITWWGLGANLMLAAVKCSAGIWGQSQAVVADAVHSLSDTSTDIAILVGVQYWNKPPDTSHPHGHQRIEMLITLLIGVVLASVALGLGYNAIATLQAPHNAPPHWIAFGAALVSILVKEALYRWTVAVGERVHSSALIANAWHHRSDAFSSIPAALAVAGAHLAPRWSFLDHVGALIVSLLILQAAWRIVQAPLGKLADRGAPEDVLQTIRDIAAGTPGVIAVHALRSRYVGCHSLQVDLHIVVDDDMTVHDGHDISENVKARLLQDGPNILDVVVHLEPESAAPRADGP